ncbi:MAG: phosphatase PAP2 family protein [Candidatus Aminicenantes bacterium]|nr:MAG: phosphatase PAP2 family protein [Candidatus Aminicenantes bacterium]
MKLKKSILKAWNWRYAGIRFRLMDINLSVYMGLIGLLVIFFRKNVDNWANHVLIHTVFVIGILEIVRLVEKHPENKLFSILRTFYPVVFFLYAWEELAVLQSMIYGSFWFTDTLVRWDKLLFGVHPTVWVQNLYNPWLDELMNFIYASYYTFFLLVPLIFYIRKKKEVSFAIYSLATFTYMTNFVFFYLLPALGAKPASLLAGLHVKEQTGFLFVELNRIIQAKGGIACGAFPSSHVAGALVWALSALRYDKKLGYIILPFAIGIGFSTVYLTLHHAVDPISGYIWGAFSFILGLRLIKIRREDPI